jgi:hypothetical protein
MWGVSDHAWAWADIGHKIICELAYHEMTPKARDAVRKLLASDEEFKTFSDSPPLAHSIARLVN